MTQEGLCGHFFFFLSTAWNLSLLYTYAVCLCGGERRLGGGGLCVYDAGRPGNEKLSEETQTRAT